MLSRFSNFQLLLFLGAFAVVAVAVKVYDSMTIDYSELPGVNDLDFEMITSTLPTGEDLTLLPLGQSNWGTLSFQLPGDQSYSLQKTNGEWLVDGASINPDSLNFIFERLTSLTGSKVISGIEKWRLKNPDYVLSISDTANQLLAELKTYTFWERGKTENREVFMVLSSSVNPEVMFDCRADSLLWKLYPGKHRFN